MQRKQEIETDICNKLDQLGITMFGRRIHNPNPLQGKRVSYDIHPYTKQGTGVSCTITYTDRETKIPYVLLSKKQNKNLYDQIGGYTHGQGPEGSEISYEKRTEDARDKDEEELIGNKNAIQIVNNEESACPDKKIHTLKEIKEISLAGFFEQQSTKLGKKINPLEMKKKFSKHGITFPNDYNAWETALREIKEETGLILNNLKPKELYTSDDFGITNDERLHTKVTHYLFHLGSLSDGPIVKAASDIELLKWVPVTDIDLKNRCVINDLPIRDSYLLQTLPRAIKKLRELELANVSDQIFIKYKSLGAYTFSNPFSESACQYHQVVLAKAMKISNILKSQLESDEYEHNFSIQPGASK